MTNEELKKKVNNHGYVLPENSYQFKYPVCTNTHLNNSSPKPFMKAELVATSASPKPVKKVEFDTDDKSHKKTIRRESIKHNFLHWFWTGRSSNKLCFHKRLGTAVIEMCVGTDRILELIAILR
jgi:hypothetical protein